MREPDRIIRLKTVLSRTGLSRSTIYRKIAEGTFPAQLKISADMSPKFHPGTSRVCSSFGSIPNLRPV
jgi:hypothetical protein